MNSEVQTAVIGQRLG